jgi:hypothetical protein
VTAEALFSIAGMQVVAGWLLLVVALGDGRWTHRYAASLLIGGLYARVFASHIREVRRRLGGSRCRTLANSAPRRDSVPGSDVSDRTCRGCCCIC